VGRRPACGRYHAACAIALAACPGPVEQPHAVAGDELVLDIDASSACQPRDGRVDPRACIAVLDAWLPKSGRGGAFSEIAEPAAGRCWDARSVETMLTRTCSRFRAAATGASGQVDCAEQAILLTTLPKETASPAGSRYYLASLEAIPTAYTDSGCPFIAVRLYAYAVVSSSNSKVRLRSDDCADQLYRVLW